MIKKMKIKEILTRLTAWITGKAKEPEQLPIQEAHQPADINTPPSWQPYTDKCRPMRSGWYAVVYGTRCQIKWYDVTTDTFSKIPLNYPVEFFLVLPPLPVMGRPVKDKNRK